MDRVEKALKKLTAKERKFVKELVEKIESKKLDGLDIKKLKAREDVFRCRKGDIRIIYHKSETNEIYILTIERRAEKTYKNL